jgi:cyclopropane-fatty-acyl-phospholipid synthase
MSLVTVATNVIERVPFPDAITSAGISFLVDRTRRRLVRDGSASESISPA